MDETRQLRQVGSIVLISCYELGHQPIGLGLLRSCGIAFRPSLVAFTPWTTLDDYLDVLGFVEMERLIDHIDPVQYSIRLLIPPGSGLLSEPSIRPHLVGLDRASFTYRWTHPDPRMDELQAEVAAEVERASSSDEDAAVTFGRVKRLAFGLHKHRRAGGETGLTEPNTAGSSDLLT